MKGKVTEEKQEVRALGKYSRVAGVDRKEGWHPLFLCVFLLLEKLVGINIKIMWKKGDK